MELNINARPATNETASIAASSVQSTQFKERRLREAQSDVRNEAVYFSPVIRIDKDTQAMVIQYRDDQTGEVKNQYPNKGNVKAYQQADDTTPPPVVVAQAEAKIEPGTEEPKSSVS